MNSPEYAVSCASTLGMDVLPTARSGGLVVSDGAGEPGIRRAHSLVHDGPGVYRLTDLRATRLAGVESAYFRLFVPVKLDRMRLPTSLPEFRDLRHRATLSDSPVTAAAALGGHWSEHNLAAITHLAACNFRCSYCYVDYRHLSGKDSSPTSAAELVDEFRRLRSRLAETGRRLSILRLSGGEPLLAPGLVADVHGLMSDRGLLADCLLKVESNVSVLPYAYTRLEATHRTAFLGAIAGLTVHATRDLGCRRRGAATFGDGQSHGKRIEWFKYRGQNRITTRLRACKLTAALPTSSARTDVPVEIAKLLRHACREEWTELEAADPPSQMPGRIERFGRRLGSALLLAVAAFALPAAFGSSIPSATADNFRDILLVSAVVCLIPLPSSVAQRIPDTFAGTLKP